MERLKNFPFALIFVVYLGYLGFQLYDFNYSPDGRVEQHKTSMAASQKELEELKKKMVEGQKFVKSIEAKKAEMQVQIKKLAEYQGALSENLDVAGMIRLLITEAKKLDLRVDKVEPGKKTQKEYYLEQEFKLETHGTFQQITLFTQRVSQLQRILRIENYTLKPVPALNGKVRKQIQAQLSVHAYQYSMSKEDRITVGGTK